LSFVNDPNPELARQNVENPVPLIQIREMESILRLNNGQIGVLGGLMQDEERSLDAATPGISKIPFFGEVFKSRQREFSKTELVIFLRPVVIRTPSIDSDLNMFRRYLEQNTSATPAGGVN
jgi:general secretion pathway protein D